MKSLTTLAIYLTTVLFLHACSSTPQLTESEALENYPAVATLQQSVQQGDDKMLWLLAPKSYQGAKDALAEAKPLAMEDSPEANKIAESGQLDFDRAVTNAESASDIFAEVLEARVQALEGGSSDVASQSLQEIDDDFIKLSIELEEGDASKAKMQRPEMIERYKNLELAAIKKSTVDQAIAALKQAEERGAKKYADKTYAAAENELNLASSILDSDRSNDDLARQHAEKSIWQSERSMSISDTVNGFNENDFSHEDIVLWYQSQLVKVSKPLKQEVPLNVANHNLVDSVANSIQDVVDQREALKVSLAASGAHYDSELTAKATELSAMEMVQQQNNKKIKGIQQIFSEDEAAVYLQHNNVLIRAHGFWFPSGGSEIDARNFSLLNKIKQSVSQFPNSKIVVSGHTDSTGSTDANLDLSKKRAEKVSKFLSEAGGVSSERLRSEGYGKEQPVSSNETPEGRALNRRVEVLIVNE